MKPAHQWETRQHRAVRRELGPEDAAKGARTEAFDLEFADGHVGTAVLGLDEQVVDERSAKDPDVAHAVRCWLAARGRRRANLRTHGGAMLDGNPFDVAELGTAADASARIVTLAPSNAEVVHALGCFGRVVAAEASSDFPPAVAELERLGPDLGPDLERVVELAPDLVLSSLSVPGMERVVTGLRARGLPQLVLAPRRYADVLGEIERVGRALGVADNAATVVAELRRQRAELEAARRERRVRVYLEWWPKPMFTPGADCYSAELIDLAGGVNVFGDRPGASLQITAEELVAAAPEVCFVSWCGVREDKLDPQNLVDRPGLQGLPAARAGHVYPLDEQFSGRPGPRMLEASRRMAAALRRI